MRILNSLRSINDPLRSPAAAAKWIAALPTGDAPAVQRRALELVSRFGGPGRQIGPRQVEALLIVDARLEPVIAELTRDYVAHYETSTEVELRLWHQVFDLIKAFAAAYQAALRVGYPRADDRQWRALLPWVLVRLTYYKGQDGKFRLFRYSRWTPPQWRELHELYEFARMRGWQREQLVLGAASFSRPGICVEQEYLQTLLLMRLDSGNFTADQVDWISRQLEDWSPSLALVPPPADDASLFVDLTSAQGLRRQDRPHTGGRVLYLDVGPVYTRIVERMRWLPEQDEPGKPGEPPVREQRLLLMRLAALFGPETLAIAPRAARYSIGAGVRVVFGRDAICRAVADTDEAAPAGTGAGGTRGDEATAGEAAAPADGAGGETWTMADASETGCRLTARLPEAPAKLGELLAMRHGADWSLGVLRRMQRTESDEISLGVEIIARRQVPVMLRSWTAATPDGRVRAGRPFLALYLPAPADKRQAARRSLIGPRDRLVAGEMIEFDTGKARYLIRFTQVLEQQADWSWALFSAVRSLAA